MRMRRIIILVLVGIAALVTWSIISSRHHYGSLEISAPAATPGNAHANVTVENDSGYKKSLVLSPGGKTTLRLKRGIYRVTGSAGSSKSITTVEVSGLRATLETPQGSQHAIQKIGSNAENCATAVANVTYSYNCGANGTVFQHVPLDPNRLATYNILFNSQKFTWLVPIQNGLIGFAVKENSPRELLFLNLQTQTVEPISLPSEVADALRSDEPSIILR
jgi:hypothetical protein